MKKRILLVNDDVGYGKSSITMQLPIISAFGDIPSSVIASYLSNNSKYQEKIKISLANKFLDIFDVYRKNNFVFDGMITGYIDNSDNILELRDFAEDMKLENDKMLLLVDPVFADDGKKYCSITDSHIDNYKKLMEMADIITPNLTEACFLTGIDYEDIKMKLGLLKFENNEQGTLKELSEKIIKTIFPILEKIVVKKNQISVITGLNLFNSVVTVLDIYNGDKNVRETTCNYSNRVDDRNGAGDLFDALYLVCFMNGFNLVDSLSVSTSFINNALRYSNDNKYPIEEGIIYEPILFDNMIVIRDRLKKAKEEFEKLKKDKKI